MARTAKAEAAGNALRELMLRAFGVGDEVTAPMIEAYMDSVELNDRLETAFSPGGGIRNILVAIRNQTDKIP